jgi:hypothetical protein
VLFCNLELCARKLAKCLKFLASGRSTRGHWPSERALEALGKKEREGETEKLIKIWFSEFHPLLNGNVLFCKFFFNLILFMTKLWCCLFLTLRIPLMFSQNLKRVGYLHFLSWDHLVFTLGYLSCCFKISRLSKLFFALA